MSNTTKKRALNNRSAKSRQRRKVKYTAGITGLGGVNGGNSKKNKGVEGIEGGVQQNKPTPIDEDGMHFEWHTDFTDKDTGQHFASGYAAAIIGPGGFVGYKALDVHRREKQEAQNKKTQKAAEEAAQKQEKKEPSKEDNLRRNYETIIPIGEGMINAYSRLTEHITKNGSTRGFEAQDAYERQAVADVQKFRSPQDAVAWLKEEREKTQGTLDSVKRQLAALDEKPEEKPAPAAAPQKKPEDAVEKKEPPKPVEKPAPKEKTIKERKPVAPWKARTDAPTEEQKARMSHVKNILGKEWAKVYRRVADLKEAGKDKEARRVLLTAGSRYFNYAKEAYERWGDGDALSAFGQPRALKESEQTGENIAESVRERVNALLNQVWKEKPETVHKWANSRERKYDGLLAQEAAAKEAPVEEKTPEAPAPDFDELDKQYDGLLASGALTENEADELAEIRDRAKRTQDPDDVKAFSDKIADIDAKNNPPVFGEEEQPEAPESPAPAPVEDKQIEEQTEETPQEDIKEEESDEVKKARAVLDAEIRVYDHLRDWGSLRGFIPQNDFEREICKQIAGLKKKKALERIAGDARYRKQIIENGGIPKEEAETKDAEQAPQDAPVLEPGVSMNEIAERAAAVPDSDKFAATSPLGVKSYKEGYLDETFNDNVPEELRNDPEIQDAFRKAAAADVAALERNAGIEQDDKQHGAFNAEGDFTLPEEKKAVADFKRLVDKKKKFLSDTKITGSADSIRRRREELRKEMEEAGETPMPEDADPAEELRKFLGDYGINVDAPTVEEPKAEETSVEEQAEETPATEETHETPVLDELLSGSSAEEALNADNDDQRSAVKIGNAIDKYLNKEISFRDFVNSSDFLRKIWDSALDVKMDRTFKKTALDNPRLQDFFVKIADRWRRYFIDRSKGHLPDAPDDDFFNARRIAYNEFLQERRDKRRREKLEAEMTANNAAAKENEPTQEAPAPVESSDAPVVGVVGEPNSVVGAVVGEESETPEIAAETPEEPSAEAASDAPVVDTTNAPESDVANANEPADDISKRFEEELRNGKNARDMQDHLHYLGYKLRKQFQKEMRNDPVIQKAMLDYYDSPQSRIDAEILNRTVAARHSQWLKDRSVIKDRKPLPYSPDDIRNQIPEYYLNDPKQSESKKDYEERIKTEDKFNELISDSYGKTLWSQALKDYFESGYDGKQHLPVEIDVHAKGDPEIQKAFIEYVDKNGLKTWGEEWDSLQNLIKSKIEQFNAERNSNEQTPPEPPVITDEQAPVEKPAQEETPEAPAQSAEQGEPDRLIAKSGLDFSRTPSEETKKNNPLGAEIGAKMRDFIYRRNGEDKVAMSLNDEDGYFHNAFTLVKEIEESASPYNQKHLYNQNASQARAYGIDDAGEWPSFTFTKEDFDPESESWKTAVKDAERGIRDKGVPAATDDELSRIAENDDIRKLWAKVENADDKVSQLIDEYNAVKIKRAEGDLLSIDKKIRSRRSTLNKARRDLKDAVRDAIRQVYKERPASDVEPQTDAPIVDETAQNAPVVNETPKQKKRAPRPTAAPPRKSDAYYLHKEDDPYYRNGGDKGYRWQPEKTYDSTWEDYNKWKNDAPDDFPGLGWTNDEATGERDFENDGDLRAARKEVMRRLLNDLGIEYDSAILQATPIRRGINEYVKDAYNRFGAAGLKGNLEDNEEFAKDYEKIRDFVAEYSDVLAKHLHSINTDAFSVSPLNFRRQTAEQQRDTLERASKALDKILKTSKQKGSKSAPFNVESESSFAKELSAAVKALKKGEEKPESEIASLYDKARKMFVNVAAKQAMTSEFFDDSLEDVNAPVWEKNLSSGKKDAPVLDFFEDQKPETSDDIADAVNENIPDEESQANADAPVLEEQAETVEEEPEAGTPEESSAEAPKNPTVKKWNFKGWHSPNGTATFNNGRFAIKFNGLPIDETRAALKRAGFKWDKESKEWYFDGTNWKGEDILPYPEDGDTREQNILKWAAREMYNSNLFDSDDIYRDAFGKLPHGEDESAEETDEEPDAPVIDEPAPEEDSKKKEPELAEPEQAANAAPVEDEQAKKERMYKHMLDVGAITQAEYNERMGLNEPDDAPVLDETSDEEYDDEEYDDEDEQYAGVPDWLVKKHKEIEQRAEDVRAAFNKQLREWIKTIDPRAALDVEITTRDDKLSNRGKLKKIKKIAQKYGEYNGDFREVLEAALEIGEVLAQSRGDLQVARTAPKTYSFEDDSDYVELGEDGKLSPISKDEREEARKETEDILSRDVENPLSSKELLQMYEPRSIEEITKKEKELSEEWEKDYDKWLREAIRHNPELAKELFAQRVSSKSKVFDIADRIGISTDDIRQKFSTLQDKVSRLRHGLKIEQSESVEEPEPEPAPIVSNEPPKTKPEETVEQRSAKQDYGKAFSEWYRKAVRVPGFVEATLGQTDPGAIFDIAERFNIPTDKIRAAQQRLLAAYGAESPAQSEPAKPEPKPQPEPAPEPEPVEEPEAVSEDAPVIDEDGVWESDEVKAAREAYEKIRDESRDLIKAGLQRWLTPYKTRRTFVADIMNAAKNGGSYPEFREIALRHGIPLDSELEEIQERVDRARDAYEESEMSIQLKDDDRARQEEIRRRKEANGEKRYRYARRSEDIYSVDAPVLTF